MKEKIYNALPYLVLLAGLLNTGYFWYNSNRLTQQRQEIEFNNLTANIKGQIQDRLQSYVDELIASAAFLKSSGDVRQEEWGMFVSALELDTYYPGINGIGLAVPVLKQDSAAFLKQVRAESQPEFNIAGFGKTPQAPDLFVIRFIEPFKRNRRALGFDMGSEPIRRKAMVRARDHDDPALSGKVELVQDQEQLPGFLIYVPVFRDSQNALTPKGEFLGWTFAPFIARNFMGGLRNAELKNYRELFEIELFDKESTDHENLLFSSVEKAESNSDLIFTNTFPVYGNTWTIRLTATEKFRHAYEGNLSLVILIGGIVLSFMIFFLLRSLADTRLKAMLLAEKMTAELRALNADLDKKVAERTEELAAQNEKLNLYTEHLKNSYEDLEVKVKFRNLELEKQLQALKDENARLKAKNG
ncbi:CHASE domain-containing protein [Adhaeribacter soli]|uniref:CHASE domain-containing protein n=1 Tax=Adhaeribacter soli TaxID=2607655 RepID=A0A5N1J2G5_9BACT|nr:CHASE domain-containing protein [Adhaeribacter soli]KAA9340696.1 hypothetical protein F0P94_04520 [Adhaeribacter soli]